MSNRDALFYCILPLLLRDPTVITEQDVINVGDAYTQLGREALAIYADHEKALPFVSYSLWKMGIDESYWKVVFAGFTERSSKIVELLKRSFTAAKEAGVSSFCVVENFGAVLTSGIPIGCFGSDDVDVTADASEKDTLLRALCSVGFEVGIRGHHASDTKELTTMRNPNGLGDGEEYWLNIMWLPISRATFIVQDRYANRLAQERFQKFYYQDTDIGLLQPDAMLYFCALHIACGHFYTVEPGMRLYCDIDRIVRYCQVDLEKLRQWAREDGIGYRLELVLEIVDEFLGTDCGNGGEGLRGERGYLRLKKRVVNMDAHRFTPSYGKVNRMMVELMSDRRCLAGAMINRIFQSKII